MIWLTVADGANIDSYKAVGFMALGDGETAKTCWALHVGRESCSFALWLGQSILMSIAKSRRLMQLKSCEP